MSMRGRPVTASFAAFCAALCLAACSNPPQPGGAAPAKDAPLQTLSMQTVSGIPFVELQIGQSRPLTFMIDTGFDVNVLNIETARDLGLGVGEDASESMPGGEVSTAEIADVALRAGDFTLNDVAFTGIDISELGAFVGRRFDGILGHDFLEKFVVDLDYAQSEMRLFDSENWTYSGDGAVLATTIVDKEPLIDCILDLPGGRSVTAHLKLDTGSMDVAGLSLNFVRDEKIIAPFMPERTVSGIAVGGETESKIFRVLRFRIGEVVIEQAQLGYTVASSDFEERANDGTVGAGAFARNRLILDYPHAQIILEDDYRGRAAEEFNSGMLLVAPPPNYSRLIAFLVVPGGAADKAGLSAGDEILSIDGETPSLAEARLRLQSATPAALIYRHEGRETAATLTPEPLLPPAEL